MILKKKLKKLEEELKDSFTRWHHLKENGGSDPFWEDGTNMNLVRNHIFHHKQEIKNICDKEGIPLPNVYSKDTPPKVDEKYMARAEEITVKAKESLVLYENDANHIKIKNAIGITNKEKAQIAQNILGYVDNLKKAIAENDLVTMRRHCHPEGYLKSFQEFVAQLTEEDFEGQLSLF